MITRKHLLLAIAATCLLTMFLITIVPIRSQSVGQYDPWLDYNDDGKIDGRDIAPAARAFGTFGDPTKDVNVTNWPATIQTIAAYDNATISWVNPLPGVADGYHLMSVIETKGYRKIYFSLKGNLTAGESILCNLTVGWVLQGKFNSSVYWWSQIDHYEEYEYNIYDVSAWREFDVKGETMTVWIGNLYANSYELSYYMTA